MSLREVFEVLPHRLRTRFESLGQYVYATIDEIEAERRLGRRRDLSRDERQTIQTIIFVVAISRFLRDGTRAAKLATDAFQSLGAGGFRVGNTEFQGRNDNVMMGQHLAELLEGTLGNDEIRGWANSNRPLGDIIRQLVERRSHE